jgi:hypothetical protein
VPLPLKRSPLLLLQLLLWPPPQLLQPLLPPLLQPLLLPRLPPLRAREIAQRLVLR